MEGTVSQNFHLCLSFDLILNNGELMVIFVKLHFLDFMKQMETFNNKSETRVHWLGLFMNDH